MIIILSSSLLGGFDSRQYRTSEPSHVLDGLT